MIDKLEVRVDPGIPFTSEFGLLYQRISRKRTSKYYKEQIDLRPYGYPVILYRFCRYNATHKLSFLRTAHIPLPQMSTQIERIFDCESHDLRLARVDVAVDVLGLPIEWFRCHVRVPGKRNRSEIGGTSSCIETQGITNYFGRGKDFIRIYDKNAELESRQVGETSADDSPVTRIERQIRSGRMPAEFKTFGALCQNLLTFNPFSRVVILPGGKPDPSIGDYSAGDYLQGKGLRQLILDIGLAEAWAVLNGRSSGNAGRVFRKLKDFIPTDPKAFRVPDLFAMYKKGLRSQLADCGVQN